MTESQADTIFEQTHSRRGLTLLEVLVVVVLIAILVFVVIRFLDPSQLLKQSRDSTRLNGLQGLNLAITAYKTGNGGSMGTASTTYISIPDPAATSTSGSNCGSLGLPSLPSGWVYHCAASSTYKMMNGTGWVPLDLRSTPGANLLGTLPVDPSNTTSTGLYYTYTTDGTYYELTGIMESTKQRNTLKSTSNLTMYPGVDALGSSYTLSPLYSSSGLLGYWKLDDGSSGTTPTTASDSSGNGYNGTLTNSPTWTGGQVGNSLTFSKAAYSYVTMGNVTAMQGLYTISVSAWIKTSDTVGSDENHFVDKDTCDGGAGTAEWEFFEGNAGGSNKAGTPEFVVTTAGGAANVYDTSKKKINDGSWHLITGTFDAPNSVQNLYVDGVLYAVTYIGAGSSATGTQAVEIGGDCNTGGSTTNIFPGSVDDVRFYNRALSAAEVLALYNAER